MGIKGLIPFLNKGEPEKQGHATIEAVIIRADGTVENLGVIAEGDITYTAESE